MVCLEGLLQHGRGWGNTMHEQLTATAVFIAALAYIGPSQAHHSLRMFDISAPIWIRGTVVSYEAVNPHTLIALEEKTPDGRIQQWTVEGPILARLKRMAIGPDFLKPGDVIQVCGFSLEESFAKERAAHIGSSPARFVHGHLLLMPDGRMQPWGPYGKLDNCVRPGDPTESWVEFLNRDRIARDLWCAPHRTSVPTRADAKALVDAIDSRLSEPCN